MTLGDILVSVWRQSLDEKRTEVEIEGIRHRVGATRRQALKTVTFTYAERPIEGIEQNPETKSNWAKLAREGQRIMQFRCRGRYIANVCEGRLLRYPAWASLGLPD